MKDKEKILRAIRKAAKEGNVVFAESEGVSIYEDEQELLLADLLGRERWLITDESQLNHFPGCGLPLEIVNSCDSDEAINAAWDVWVLEQIEKRFGVKLKDTYSLFLDVFRQMRKERKV